MSWNKTNGFIYQSAADAADPHWLSVLPSSPATAVEWPLQSGRGAVTAISLLIAAFVWTLIAAHFPSCLLFGQGCHIFFSHFVFLVIASFIPDKVDPGPLTQQR
jgi:hypothetical protein